MHMRSNVLCVSALLFGASLVSAQALSSVSSGCQKALGEVVASPDAACLNPGGLLAFAAAGKNSSLVPALNNWLSGICSAAPCTNQSLSTIVTKVVGGCPAELKELGLNVTSPSDAVTSVQQVYPTIRKVGCLKDDSTSQNCITETLTNIEKTTGPLSVSKVVGLLSDVTTMTGLPKDAVCNNCMKAAYNIVKQDLPNFISPSASTAISNQCGASFVDGQNPSGISQTASGLSTAASPSPSPKNGGAMSSIPLQYGGAFFGLTLSLLVAVASTFAFFV